MKLNLIQSFLLFLRDLISSSRKQWVQFTRRLWHILALLRSRFPPRRPKQRDDLRRTTGSPPTKSSPPTVICPSQLPQHIPRPIVSNDSPTIASPTPITIEVRRATILDTEDTIDGYRENESTVHLGVETYFQEGEGSIFHTPPISSRSTSRASSTQSYYLAPQDGRYRRGNRPLPQHPNNPSSECSPCSSPSLTSGEGAACGHLFAPPSTTAPSPAPSFRQPSEAGSTSHVHQASRPHSRVRRPAPIMTTPKHSDKSPTPSSARPSPGDAPPDPTVSEALQPKSRVLDSAHHTHIGADASFGPPPAPQPRGILRPMIQIDRYQKHSNVTIEGEGGQFICPPVTREFPRNSLPQHWIPLMHPEGALYWVHEVDPIYTDTNMCDPLLRRQIEVALEEIEVLKVDLLLSAGDWELALELGEDGKTGEPICSYYFVCNRTRCLFWLHEFDLHGTVEGLRGVTEWSHIYLALQAQYWTHWEMYPHSREVPERLLQELLGVLVHAGVDCMTSSNSTAPYSEGELSKLLSYAKNITSVGGSCGFSACVVGRLMSFLTYARYLNFYGQRGARLTTEQTIYGNQQKRTYLIKIMSVFLFFAPEIHLKGLESAHMDFVLYQHRWAQFITRLQEDWKEFILYGTVLLNANVAFLAVPSVDPGNHNRSPVQLASYFSIIASVGSIATGLLLLRQHKAKLQDSAEVDHYLRSRRSVALGFEILAILYSLPYSLLLWSTTAFAAAFCLETIVFSHQLWVKLSVGVVLVLAMAILLASWCVGIVIEAKNFSVRGALHHVKEQLLEFTRSLRGKTSRPNGGGMPEKERGALPPGCLKEAFSVFRRRRGILTSPTPVRPNPIMGEGIRQPESDCTEVEMSEFGAKESGCEV